MRLLTGANADGKTAKRLSRSSVTPVSVVVTSSPATAAAALVAPHLKHELFEAKTFIPQPGQVQSPGRTSEPPPPPPPPY
eukprot:CAMPEP_0204307802 /NCGR_PEP_ID=MMETSP0469-20131031/129_1 /ASSEMBLY_ACC=CAM_ASM_000384 /TAXON_ID=2969 /ORGANISM="Oxyrrhis marina" /LENGTH=79 /DNA_ID=CAMNT_0051287189 /DNA_START=1050 /DNA_END=1287 /DNA_ORIENTATION=+